MVMTNATERGAGDIVLTSSTEKRVLVVEKAVTGEVGQWRVRLGEKEKAIVVSLRDPNFLAGLKDGSDVLEKGDALLADVQMTQVISDGRLNVCFAIRKVYDHKKFVEQLIRL